MTPLKLGQNAFPRCIHGTLKVHGLHAHQRKNAAAPEQSRRARAPRMMNMLFERLPQPLLLLRFDLLKSDKLGVQHIPRFGAHHVSQAAGHSRTEVQSERPKDDCHASGHVFTSMLAHAFHHRKRAAVADRKSFARPASDEQLARCRTIKYRVSRKNIASPRSRASRRNHNRSTGQAFAHIVVRFAGEFDRHALS